MSSSSLEHAPVSPESVEPVVSEAAPSEVTELGRDADRFEWVRLSPFLALQAASLGVIWTGASTVAVLTAVALYAIRMFAITGFYHRYFSHRTFKTSRAFQFVMAVVGASSVQRGPLWWAAHHRNHHRYSDTEKDVHSPVVYGFWWSHTGWFGSKRNFATPPGQVKDLERFAELRWLDRFDVLPGVALAASLFGVGVLLERVAPGLGTNGWQMLVWGFFISTTVLYHATYTINSLSHVFGRQRFATGDQSRNNWFLALLTFGEGWHNNHHHYPASTRQGFYWWELDLTYLGLRFLAACRLIRDLKPVPPHVLAAGRLPRAVGESVAP